MDRKGAVRATLLAEVATIVIFAISREAFDSNPLLYLTILLTVVGVVGVLAMSLGVKAFRGLWGVMALYWLFLMLQLSVSSRGVPVEILRNAPDRFAVWSAFALPLALLTWLQARAAAYKYSNVTVFAGVLAIWSVAVFISSRIMAYAPDVGVGPRSNPAMTWVGGTFCCAAPLLLAGWLGRRVPSRAETTV